MTDASGHAQVPVPPPLVFLAYLIAALGLHLLMPLPAPWPTATGIVGAVLLLGGFWLAGSGVSRMLRSHTSPDPAQPSTALVTDGPYRFSRNPIYLGFSLIFLGFALLAGTLWGLLLTPFLLVTITRLIVRAEERYLHGRFEQRYREYTSRVRQWL